MINAVTELLKLRGSVHRTVILETLKGAGIMGHERNPMAHLAAFPSSEKDKFAPDGKGNFTLKPKPVAPDLQPAEVSEAGHAGVDDAATSSATLEPVTHEKGGVIHEPAAQR